MNRRVLIAVRLAGAAMGVGGGLAISAMLNACATSPLAPPVIAVKQVCVPIKEYTPAEQKAAGAALAALEPTNPLIGFVLDYKAMRDMDRVCIASTQGKP